MVPFQYDTYSDKYNNNQQFPGYDPNTPVFSLKYFADRKKHVFFASAF